MRSLSILLSVLLHVTLLFGGVFWARSAPMKIDLNVPVYEVEMVTIKAPPPPKPKPKPKPVVKKEVSKPAPAPVPDKAQKISPKKVKRPAVKEKPKPNKQDILKNALKKAQTKAKKNAKAEEQKRKDQLAKDLAALQKQTALEDAKREAQAEQKAAAAGMVRVYAQIVEQRIKENWRYPTVGIANDLVCTVEIRLGPDGTITDSTLLTSSGRSDFDASALRAVTETAQLPPPPGKGIEAIQINFNLQELLQ